MGPDAATREMMRAMQAAQEQAMTGMIIGLIIGLAWIAFCAWFMISTVSALNEISRAMNSQVRSSERIARTIDDRLAAMAPPVPKSAEAEQEDRFRVQ